MSIRSKLSDYTEAEKAHFDAMHQALAVYNAALATGSAAQVPNYTDDEMAEYSRFREILMTALAEEH